MIQNIEFFINIAKFYSILSKSLEGKLGGIGFTDFIVLYYLNNAPENKLKRIELAEKVGLTASGVTRLLLPMEKIGLVSKESNPNDARVSFVILTPGGKNKLEEALERIEIYGNEIFSSDSNNEIKDINKFLTEIGGKIMWK
ncbi:MAG: MarR family transcriptional regulator [Candidatus Gracilibacteria bacterium]|nr:MarR family transcriptional regulator [Candidatus Gracilibacteria bacterium]